MPLDRSRNRAALGPPHHARSSDCLVIPDAVVGELVLVRSVAALTFSCLGYKDESTNSLYREPFFAQGIANIHEIDVAAEKTAHPSSEMFAPTMGEIHGIAHPARDSRAWGDELIEAVYLRLTEFRPPCGLEGI
jgi:hypothetical protein